MYTIDLSGKTALVFGIANQRSIAWSITKSLHDAGASIIAAYQNDRVKPSVDKLTSELDRISTVECDVSDDRNVEKTFARIKEQTDRLDIVVHSIAFAQREDLGGRFVDTDREGFRVALDISAYSLVSITRNAFPMMTEGGSILTLSLIHI